MKKFIMGTIFGILLCVITYVVADTINSNEVLYDNSDSVSNDTTVKGALDSLFDIVDHSSTGFSLLAHNISGLSSQLEGGLYRYQGAQDVSNNVNNYICFGTTSKSSCVSDNEKYMYRIIGINEAGQLKVIKKDAFSYAWSSNSSSVWANSTLYNGLNGSYFLTNTDYIPNSTWSDKIVTVNWKYGDITDVSKTASEIYNIEMAFSNSVNAKIGLMYIHDYYYGMPGNNNCSSNPASCKPSWLHINNGSHSQNSEFLIDRYAQSYIWCTDIRGKVWKDNLSNIGSTYSVRPVFYISANESITSGSGTITDPYILN